MRKGVLPPFFLILPLLGGCAHRPVEPAAEAQRIPAGEQIAVPQQADPDADPVLRQATAKAARTRPDRDPRYALPEARSRSLTIYLGSQTFEYMEDDRVVASGPISSGSAQHPTPTGSFRVLSKDRNKRSGKYTNYFDQNTPMPYSLQFYGPYFIHEGWLPGHADSHGCVRLKYEDAKLLFSRVKVGDPVIVKRQGRARAANPFGDGYPFPIF